MRVLTTAQRDGGGLDMGMDAQCRETSFYVFSACIYCTAGLIKVRSLSFCCKLLNKNYFQKKTFKIFDFFFFFTTARVFYK